MKTKTRVVIEITKTNCVKYNTFSGIIIQATWKFLKKINKYISAMHIRTVLNSIQI